MKEIILSIILIIFKVFLLIMDSYIIKPINFPRTKSEIGGSIQSSPSKSYSHRAFFLSLLANSESFLINPLTKGDVKVTIDICKNFGAKIERIDDKEFLNILKTKIENNLIGKKEGNLILLKELKNKEEQKEIHNIWRIIPPKKLKLEKKIINGKNSGTSIRIAISLAPLLQTPIEFRGIFFEKKRPIKPLLEVLNGKYIEYTIKDNPSAIVIKPKSRENTEFQNIIKIRGDVSTQFITGLMLLATKLGNKDKNKEPKRKENIIDITSKIKSYPYLLISEKIMNDWGIIIKREDYRKEPLVEKYNKSETEKINVNKNKQIYFRYIIPSTQNWKGQIYRIPGDFSSAAFIIAFAVLNPFDTKIEIKNLDLDDPQGDKALVEILKKMGAKIDYLIEKKTLSINGNNKLMAINIDCSNFPDLFPILSVIGLHSYGTFKIYNAEHVRLKETDRISVMVRELSKMGAIIKELKDGIEINGPQMNLKGIEIKHDNDHRIAMALTIAALFSTSTSTLEKPRIVSDSYPSFFSDLKKLGAIITNNEK